MRIDSEAAAFDDNIRRFLALEMPDTYCDSCLAFVLRLDLAAVTAASARIAAGETFERLEGSCDQCDRFGPMTCAL